MPDRSVAAARERYERAVAAGVPPTVLLAATPWVTPIDVLYQLVDAASWPVIAGFASTRVATRSSNAAPSGVVTVPLTGVLTPQGSFFEFLFGGAMGGLAGFRAAFGEAVASDDVSAVVIDVDSPGGMADMVPETAAFVRSARGQGKPIVAVSDTKMLSGAYWIASQADEIVVTPSGYAGSIGAYRVHTDVSGALEQEGVRVTYVSAGKHKVAGNQSEPLAGEALKQWQEDVDDVYSRFVEDVAAGRGTTAAKVRAGYGEGRSLNATRALSEGLADRIATFDDVIVELRGGTAPPPRETPPPPPDEDEEGDDETRAALAARVAELEAALGDGLSPERAREILGLEPEPAPAAMSDEESLYLARVLTAR
jgi:signal peptide peptidase SppA